MKIKIFVTSILIILFFALGFLILTYNQGFSFKKIYIENNKEYLFTIISSALLISLATYIAQITLGNKLIDSSFMGTGPIASFVIIIIASVASGTSFLMMQENYFSNYILPLIISIALSGTGICLVTFINKIKLGKKEIIVMLLVINSFLMVMGLIILNMQTVTVRKQISTVMVSPIKQIGNLKFIFSMIIFFICLIFYLIFSHKKTKIIQANTRLASNLGVNVKKAQIINFIIIGFLLGQAIMIMGSIAFIGLMSFYISSSIFKYTSKWNLFSGLIISVIINMFTFFFFYSLLGQFDKLPFTSIISIIGVVLFLIINTKNLLRRKYEN